MLIDASLLRRAKLENIERLARSLGVDVPRRKRDSVYANQLVGAIASRIRRDAMMDELRKLTTLGTSLVGTSFSGGQARSGRPTSRTRFRTAN